MKKTLYIFSFYNGADELDYDWFVGEDWESYEDQENRVADYMVENEYAEDKKEAFEKLESVYKQDREVLLKQLND